MKILQPFHHKGAIRKIHVKPKNILEKLLTPPSYILCHKACENMKSLKDMMKKNKDVQQKAGPFRLLPDYCLNQFYRKFRT
ncbi:TPA: hypothetical protein DCG86_02665 [Candidatus Marinimicrobia bacterium]|nr:hypothetical protein [Candidatus Neomarinimicrobiota bacterium]